MSGEYPPPCGDTLSASYFPVPETDALAELVDAKILISYEEDVPPGSSFDLVVESNNPRYLEAEDGSGPIDRGEQPPELYTFRRLEPGSWYEWEMDAGDVTGMPVALYGATGVNQGVVSQGVIKAGMRFQFARLGLRVPLLDEPAANGGLVWGAPKVVAEKGYSLNPVLRVEWPRGGLTASGVGGS